MKRKRERESHTTQYKPRWWKVGCGRLIQFRRCSPLHPATWVLVDAWSVQQELTKAQQIPKKAHEIEFIGAMRRWDISFSYSTVSVELKYKPNAISYPRGSSTHSKNGDEEIRNESSRIVHPTLQSTTICVGVSVSSRKRRVGGASGGENYRRTFQCPIGQSPTGAKSRGTATPAKPLFIPGVNGTLNLCPSSTPPIGTVTLKVCPSASASKVYPWDRKHCVR